MTIAIGFDVVALRCEGEVLKGPARARKPDCESVVVKPPPSTERS